MRSKLAIIIMASTLSLPLLAQNDYSTYTNVKQIKEKADDTYKVSCKDNTQGRISSEEDNICIHSKKNRKNRCELQTEWSVTDAAEFICDGEISKEAPLHNLNSLDVEVDTDD